MSEDPKSFRERVCTTVSEFALYFQRYYVDYDYLLCSPAFVTRKYYIVSAQKNNYQHLVGVSSPLSADDFFDKCLSGKLTESDISFYKKGRSELEIKGSVRRKISVLPNIIDFFTEGCLVQEDFEKNRIFCSFAAADKCCTLGFTVAADTKPMTLLRGNQLDETKAQPLSLVLRRKRGEAKFGEIVLGSDNELRSCGPSLLNVVSDDLSILI